MGGYPEKQQTEIKNKCPWATFPFIHAANLENEEWVTGADHPTRRADNCSASRKRTLDRGGESMIEL